MKSYEQIAQAMYRAFVKAAAARSTPEMGEVVEWDQQSPAMRQCWIAAAKQAVAEMAVVH